MASHGLIISQRRLKRLDYHYILDTPRKFRIVENPKYTSRVSDLLGQLTSVTYKVNTKSYFFHYIYKKTMVLLVYQEKIYVGSKKLKNYIFTHPKEVFGC